MAGEERASPKARTAIATRTLTRVLLWGKALPGLAAHGKPYVRGRWRWPFCCTMRRPILLDVTSTCPGAGGQVSRPRGRGLVDENQPVAARLPRRLPAEEVNACGRLSLVLARPLGRVVAGRDVSGGQDFHLAAREIEHAEPHRLRSGHSVLDADRARDRVGPEANDAAHERIRGTRRLNRTEGLRRAPLPRHHQPGPIGLSRPFTRG